MLPSLCIPHLLVPKVLPLPGPGAVQMPCRGPTPRVALHSGPPCSSVSVWVRGTQPRGPGLLGSRAEHNQHGSFMHWRGGGSSFQGPPGPPFSSKLSDHSTGKGTPHRPTLALVGWSPQERTGALSAQARWVLGLPQEQPCGEGGQLGSCLAQGSPSVSLYPWELEATGTCRGRGASLREQPVPASSWGPGA